MAPGAVPTDSEEEWRSSAARRLRGGVAIGVVGLAVIATATTVLMVGAAGERRPPPQPRVDRAAAEPPIRLDALHRPKGRRGERKLVRRRGRPTPVIGVGTNRFGAHRGGAGAATDAPVVDVDGRRGGEMNEVASIGEVKEDLAALERENARIEAALRGLGGSGRGTGELIWPVRGPITSRFGPRGGRLHAGLDIGVSTGTPVRAADSGRVVISGWQGGYGNFICLQHTGRLTTCYGHNSSLRVRKGQAVRKGGVIAKSGSTGNSTGPHVHFETRVNGRPVDPMRFL